MTDARESRSEGPLSTVVRVNETDMPGLFDVLLSDGQLISDETVGQALQLVREHGFRAGVR